MIIHDNLLISSIKQPINMKELQYFVRAKFDENSKEFILCEHSYLSERYEWFPLGTHHKNPFPFDSFSKALLFINKEEFLIDFQQVSIFQNTTPIVIMSRPEMATIRIYK